MSLVNVILRFTCIFLYKPPLDLVVWNFTQNILVHLFQC